MYIDCRANGAVVHDILGFRRQLHGPNEREHSHRVDGPTAFKRDRRRGSRVFRPASRRRRGPNADRERHRERLLRSSDDNNNTTVVTDYGSARNLLLANRKKKPSENSRRTITRDIFR